MSEQSSCDTDRRRFLAVATGTVGGIAAIGLVTPFAMSLGPSALSGAASGPVEVDISRLVPDQLMTVQWQGKPVWLLSRTPSQLAALSGHDELLVDPASADPQQPVYCKNRFRSIKPELLVAVGLCTHLGCVPTYRPDVAPAWPGGFYCPCHGSSFDLAARVYKGVPAPKNLLIPPYRYLSASRIQLGTDSSGAEA